MISTDTEKKTSRKIQSNSFIEDWINSAILFLSTKIQFECNTQVKRSFAPFAIPLKHSLVS